MRNASTKNERIMNATIRAHRSERHHASFFFTFFGVAEVFASANMEHPRALAYGWDIKAADATKGATTSRINEPLKKFSAEFYLVNSTDDLNVSDFDLWTPFKEMLDGLLFGLLTGGAFGWLWPR